MQVVLPKDPQLGISFYKDLLTQCRAYQDRVGDLTIAAYRDFATAKIKVRGLKKQIEIAGLENVGSLRDQLQAAEDESDTLKYLVESLRVKRSNLYAASADIRLTVTMIEDQIRLGEIQKPETAPVAARPTASAETVEYRPPAPAPTPAPPPTPAAEAQVTAAVPEEPKKPRPKKTQQVVEAAGPEVKTEPPAQPAAPTQPTVVESIEDLDAFLSQP